VLYVFLLVVLPFCFYKPFYFNKPFLLQLSIGGFYWSSLLFSMLFSMNLSLSMPLFTSINLCTFLFQCPYLLQWTFLHLCFNELFYLWKLFYFNGPVWCFRILHWYSFLLCLFYSIFNEHVCFNAPTCFNEAFYLSTSINLSISLNFGLLRFYLGFLFYFNVVINELLCFNDLFFLLQTTFLPFCLVSLFDSMDNDILCFEVLIILWALLLQWTFML